MDGINHGGPRWAYQILADELRRIAAGLEPDEALPSERWLCQEYGVSPKTARKARRVLVAEGLVYTVPGKGSFRAR